MHYLFPMDVDYDKAFGWYVSVQRFYVDLETQIIKIRKKLSEERTVMGWGSGQLVCSIISW